MSERHCSGKEGCPLQATPSASKGPYTTANERRLMEPAPDFFEKRAVGGPLRVPQAWRGVDGGCHTQALQLCPEWVVVGMGKVTALDKHRPDKGAAEAGDPGHPLQLLQG